MRTVRISEGDDGALSAVAGDEPAPPKATVVATPVEDRWDLVLHVEDRGSLAVTGGQLLRAAIDAAHRIDPRRQLRWWVTDAGPAHDAAAATAGLRASREVLELRRPLPLEPELARAACPTRPFRAGADDPAWLEVNNRSFAWHPDQAGQQQADLERHLAADWFEPDGFLVHETSGGIDGFCWTKVHRELAPPVGEIFVIGVDPDAQGQGLGRGLVTAGLAHLGSRGLRHAMLYCESDNDAALALYADLGFVVHRRDRAYTAPAAG